MRLFRVLQILYTGDYYRHNVIQRGTKFWVIGGDPDSPVESCDIDLDYDIVNCERPKF